jgi:hypothetical protein
VALGKSAASSGMLKYELFNAERYGIKITIFEERAEQEKASLQKILG